MNEEQLEALTLMMDDIVRAGVTITFEEYKDLPSEAQAALRVAREDDRRMFALMIAEASSGPRGLASIMKKLDGGKAAAQVECDSAILRYFAPKNGGRDQQLSASK